MEDSGKMLLKSITAASSPPSRSLFLHLLHGATTLSHLAQLHAQLLLHGLSSDVALSTKLIHKLFLFNSIPHAHSLFLSVPNPDLFLFNALIKGFSHSSLPLSAISVFNHLRSKTCLCPDDFTYSLVISASTSFAMPRVGLILHAMAIVDGFGSDLFVGSALVDMYFKLHSAGPAVKMFDRLPSRDTVLCNTLISGLVRTCCFKDAIKVFKDMVSSIDSTSIVSVLPAVAELQELRFGTGIHCLVIKLGLHSCISVVTSLISLYSKCGDVETAKLLFGDIGKKDLVSYNAMISGFTCNGETECAVRLFTELVASEKALSSSLVGLIPVYSPFGHLQLTNCIHGLCVKTGNVSHSAVSTALISVYGRLNEMELARKLFDEPSEKTLASWNAMISGYTQNGFTETAISLFQEMQMSNINPNPVTLTSILSACAQLGVLSLGKWVHSLVKNKLFEDNIYVSTALIDMYAKCGSLSEARELFDLMLEKNVITWNAMISGYGLHGHGHKALELFHKMLSSGIAPTKASFLCVLYACSHAGLVTEANKIFNWMVHGYGYEPLDEHYACMVDIIGRAGNLQGALQFIKRMPVKPGPPVWGAFLGACMIHKDTKLAHMASERLLELDPHNMGYYVLMSNIYSAERNYPLAALMRQTAKQKKLIKTPGYTSIEINQVRYVFVSGDRSHPQSTAIYAELENLARKMKEAGYQADTNTALHDVEEEEKELIIKVHSEKLAIAFGLISTEPGTEIRIIKNLRVCLDCHTATKYISKITERVIVVRDANRFHHFKDGSCSCGDYW